MIGWQDLEHEYVDEVLLGHCEGEDLCRESIDRLEVGFELEGLEAQNVGARFEKGKR